MKTYTVEVWRVRRVCQEATVTVTEEELKAELGDDLSIYSDDDLKGAADDIASQKAEWKTTDSETMDGWVRNMTLIEESPNGDQSTA